MTQDELKEYKKKISNLTVNEQKMRDLHLRNVSLGLVQGPLTGYASIDKPWLKHYPEEQIMKDPSDLGIYEFLKSRIHDKNSMAINYFGKKISFSDFFKRIDTVAKAYMEMGIGEGDIVTLLLANTPENVISMYALNKIGAIPNMVDLRQKEDKLIHSINNTDTK